eukprot:gene17652-23997_t
MSGTCQNDDVTRNNYCKYCAQLDYRGSYRWVGSRARSPVPADIAVYPAIYVEKSAQIRNLSPVQLALPFLLFPPYFPYPAQIAQIRNLSPVHLALDNYAEPPDWVLGSTRIPARCPLPAPAPENADISIHVHVQPLNRPVNAFQGWTSEEATGEANQSANRARDKLLLPVANMMNIPIQAGGGDPFFAEINRDFSKDAMDVCIDVLLDVLDMDFSDLGIPEHVYSQETMAASEPIPIPIPAAAAQYSYPLPPELSLESECSLFTTAGHFALGGFVNIAPTLPAAANPVIGSSSSYHNGHINHSYHNGHCAAFMHLHTNAPTPAVLAAANHAPPICRAVSTTTTGGAAPQSPASGSFTSLVKRSHSQSLYSGCVSHGDSSMGVGSQGDETQPSGTSLQVNVSKERFAQEYENTLEKAASHLGLSAHSTRELCHQYGIKRWPNRKLQSLTALIESVSELNDNHTNNQENIRKLHALKKKILEDPNVVIPKRIEQLRQQVYKKRHLLSVKNQPNSSPTKRAKSNTRV